MRVRVKVALPSHLRTLARVDDAPLEVELEGEATVARVLDAVERDHPVLRGTIRDRATGARRPFIRFYAGTRDLSLDGPDVALPDDVADGTEVLRIIGAIAGG